MQMHPMFAVYIGLNALAGLPHLLTFRPAWQEYCERKWLGPVSIRMGLILVHVGLIGLIWACLTSVIYLESKRALAVFGALAAISFLWWLCMERTSSAESKAPQLSHWALKCSVFISNPLFAVVMVTMGLLA